MEDLEYIISSIIAILMIIGTIGGFFFLFASWLGNRYDKKLLKYTKTKEAESGSENKIDKTIAKNLNVGLVILFWIIILGLLGGLNLIKDVFSAGIIWIYVIVRQGIILLLVAIPFYLMYKFFNGKK